MGADQSMKKPGILHKQADWTNKEKDLSAATE
jgi:hypothetical protein